MGTGVIPGPDLSGLGDIVGLIRKLIDPGREKREQVEEFFLGNPDVGKQFAIAQQEQEDQFRSTRAPGLAGVGDASIGTLGVQIDVPNVLDQFGIDLDQTKQILSPFVTTAQERQTQRAEKVKLEADIAESDLRKRLALARGEHGIPEQQASLEAFKIHFDRDLTEDQVKVHNDFMDAMQALGKTDPGKARLGALAMGSPEFVTAIQNAEKIAQKNRELEQGERRLDLAEELNNLKAAENLAAQAVERGKFVISARAALNGQLKTLQEAIEGGTESQRELNLQLTNDAIATLRAVSPGAATFVLTPGNRSFWGGKMKDFNFERLAPGFLPEDLTIRYERALTVFEEADPNTDFGLILKQFLDHPDGKEFVADLATFDPEGQRGLMTGFVTHAQQRLGTLRIAQEPEEARAALSDEELDTEITRVQAEIKASGPETHTVRERLKLRSDLNALKSQKARRRPQFRGTGR